MSSVVLPLPKPSGARPPFGGPPIKTAFDSRPDDHGDPISRRIEESVRQVLVASRDADVDSAPLVRRLIAQRRKIVRQELDALRLFNPTPMPPLLNFYSLDFLAGEEAVDMEMERLYVRLLSDLDEADSRLAALLRERSA